MTDRMTIAHYRKVAGKLSVSPSGRVVAVAQMARVDAPADQIRLLYPPPELFPNRANGKHWGNTSALKASARRDAMLLARAYRTRVNFIPDAKARYQVTVTFRPAQMRADIDGMLAALKSALDGVADGLGINDRQFRPMTLDAIKADGQPCVIFEIGERNG